VVVGTYTHPAQFSRGAKKISYYGKGICETGGREGRTGGGMGAKEERYVRFQILRVPFLTFFEFPTHSHIKLLELLKVPINLILKCIAD